MKPFEESPLPSEGPALIVCDHTSLGDPLVLLATAGRPIRFLMAEEIYSRPHIRWSFEAIRCIPVQRGKRDIKAIRSMLDGLAAQEVIGLFPEGGLDRHRLDEGHLGIGYLAINYLTNSILGDGNEPSAVERPVGGHWDSGPYRIPDICWPAD